MSVGWEGLVMKPYHRVPLDTCFSRDRGGQRSGGWGEKGILFWSLKISQAAPYNGEL